VFLTGWYSFRYCKSDLLILDMKFDWKHTFGSHIQEKIKANNMLDIIKRNFIYMDKVVFIMLYKGPCKKTTFGICKLRLQPF